jgi:hypothetical protein
LNRTKPILHFRNNAIGFKVQLKDDLSWPDIHAMNFPFDEPTTIGSFSLTPNFSWAPRQSKKGETVETVEARGCASPPN